MPSKPTVGTRSLQLCIATAVTVGEALGRLSRYAPLVGDMTAVEVQPRADGAVVRLATRAGDTLLSRMLCELWLSLVVAVLQRCSGAPVRVRAVRLPSARPSAVLEFSGRDLAKPIEAGPPDELPSIGMVARRVGVSQRTLQRRLGERGLSFRAFVDDARRALALQYVRLPDVPIKQISFFLGYSSPNAFIRAFRRWSGTTPAEYVRARREAAHAG